MGKPEEKKPGLLLVANWDSDVGYAWWLMESYWVVLAKHYQPQMKAILAYPSISRIPSQITQAPIEPIEHDFSHKSLNLLKKLSLLVRNRVHTIYFSDRSTRSWVYALFRMVGVRRIVVHDHTPGVRTAPKGLKRLAKTWLNRIPWINADACIGATDYIRERFIQVGCVPPHKCHAANNGIPLRRPAASSAHERFAIPEDRAIIVTAARASRYKGGFQALEALSRLDRSGHAPEWHYLYLGDGPDREAMTHYAEELGIDGRVTFPGRVKDVLALLQSASIALHPSRGEVGYSLSILEYMLCELPVVVPDNPSVCGATSQGETGVIFREDDIADMTASIEHLLEHSEKAKTMGARAYRVVTELYALEKAHKALTGVFERLDGVR